jgi:hypothetical protein
VATLIASPTARSAAAAAIVASTAFSTYVKSRAAVPSPKMVGGSPRSIAPTNLGMTEA